MVVERVLVSDYPPKEILKRLDKIQKQIDRMENHARALLFENRFAKKGSTDLWNELRDKVKSGHMSAFSAAWEWTKSAE